MAWRSNKIFDESKLVIINDDNKDTTLDILNNKKYYSNLEILNKQHSSHVRFYCFHSNTREEFCIEFRGRIF